MKQPTLLDAIVAPGGISTCFQPIIEVDGSIGTLHSIECLSRGPAGTNVERPDILFRYTRRKRAEPMVDRACVGTALTTAGTLAASCSENLELSINVHASTLGRDRSFASYLQRSSEVAKVPLDLVTIEVVEHTPSWDDPTFFRTLEDLRDLGVRIALDDIGLGYCNYKMLLDCRPSYFKVDRYIVEGCRYDRYRRAILESLVHLAEKFDAAVIAEGIEHPADLDMVMKLGIRYLQGFLLAPPMEPAELVASGLVEGRELLLSAIASEPAGSSREASSVPA